MLVDTEGLMIAVAVHEASIADRDGARLLLEKVGDRLPRMEKVWADRGYNSKTIGEWMKERLGWTLEIVRPSRRWVRVPADEEPPPWVGLTVLPRRWVIERTIAWIMRNRRMSRDYEFLAQTTEAFVYVAMIRLMVRRLAKGAT